MSARLRALRFGGHVHNGGERHGEPCSDCECLGHRRAQFVPVPVPMTGKMPVELRFGIWPTLIVVITFRPGTSMTVTLLSCALATYSFLLSGVNVIQSGTTPTFTSPR